MSNWYQLDIKEVQQQLKTDISTGLSNAEANRLIDEHGPNRLIERGIKSPWLILWEQLSATMVVILIVAAFISALLGDYKDAIAIMAIVVINAFLGFRQEYRAEQEMMALKRLAVPNVKVRRDSHVIEISARDLVPGDIVFLEAGNQVPADGRLLESANLRVQESALTGESEPVDKDAKIVFDKDQSLGDRSNVVYMGTIVTYGRCTVVITETGMHTEFGHIASMIQTVEREPTPLQQRLDRLGRWLAATALVIVSLIFLFGLLRGVDITLMFLTSVSLAVSAVPEGLPAVVTIALALGAQRMLRRRALIRKLPAVETLGSVTVICSDKTGTLTKNQMTVTILDVAGKRIDLTHSLNGKSEQGYNENKAEKLVKQPALALLLVGGALCNDAILETDEGREDSFHTIGDPTENALIAAAAHTGLYKSNLEQVFPRVAEVPFDSDRKRMTTVHKCPKSRDKIPSELKSAWSLTKVHGVPSYLAFSKGAIHSLLEISSSVWVRNRTKPLTQNWRERIIKEHDRLAQDGMRVMAVAFRTLDVLPENGEEKSSEQDMIFVGLVAMIDPARPEVKKAVQTCQSAGIRPMMITGDHPLTAQHIASELGIVTTGSIITGQELDKLSMNELEKIVENVNVYARVSPEHKLNIVQALQNKGHIVAMTGDGVNDAPALKKADIGLAMGITGTDVAKEASDIVLQDDNFATIVAAIEEGRTIYDNIRKFIKYLLNSNSGEVWVMMLAPLFGMPLPLLPIQILWLNLVTDGLPALALGVEPAERDTMRRAPHPPGENIFSRGLGVDIIWVGLLMGLLALGIGFFYWQVDIDGNWQTMVFTTLTFSSMTIALAVRSEHDSFFSVGIFSNKLLLWSVMLTFILQLMVVYVPPVQVIFDTKALSLKELALSFGLSTLVFGAMEIKKWFFRRRKI